MRKYKAFVSIFFIVLTYNLFADFTFESVNNSVDKTHRELSKGVGKFFESIDKFFNKNVVVENTEKTSLHLIESYNINEGDGAKFSHQFRLNLVMPRTKRRLQIFANSFNDENNDNVPDDSIAVINEDENENSFNFGVEFYPVERWRKIVKIRTGPKIREGEVKLETDLQIKYPIIVNMWKYSINQYVYLENKHFSEKTELEIVRKFTKHIAFKSLSSFFVTEDISGYVFNKNFEVQFFSGERLGLSSNIGLYTSPEGGQHVDQYYISLYSKLKTPKEWLYIGVRPQMIFYKEDDFEGKSQIKLFSEFIF